MSKLKTDSMAGRDRQIKLRVNNDEYDIILNASKNDGERMQLWIRKALIKVAGFEPQQPVNLARGPKRKI